MSTENYSTKKKIFESICKATRVNTLGLFIGSGFTKALLEGNTVAKSYSWAELLEKAANELCIKRNVLNEGMPYPEVATVICQEYLKINNISYKEAERRLKFKIAELVNVSPSLEIIDEYNIIFKRLNPNWIVTTNYDLVVEKILQEKAYPINPRDSYIKTKDLIPVYHIHGSVLDPESIVITNRDYTHTLRLSDYRHARLPFLIKESTVLMVGYSLNDLNVLSAIDYSQNVYSNETGRNNHIIQLLYSQYPNSEPYNLDNGITIQEVASLSDFFQEYLTYEKSFRSEIGKETKKVNDFVELFSKSDDELVDRFVNDCSLRLEFIYSIAKLMPEFWYVYSGYIAFLNKCFGVLWNRASAPRAFWEYNNILCVLLDIIENIDYNNVPISFIDYIVNKFSEVAYFVGDDIGQSYSASSTWKTRKKNIPERFFDEYYLRRKDDFEYKQGLRLIKRLD